MAKKVQKYQKGRFLTFGELKEMPDGSIIHIEYRDERNMTRLNAFKELYKEKDYEYCAGKAHPFCIKGLKDDTILDNCKDSSVWRYTIRQAIKIK